MTALSQYVDVSRSLEIVADLITVSGPVPSNGESVINFNDRKMEAETDSGCESDVLLRGSEREARDLRDKGISNKE